MSWEPKTLSNLPHVLAGPILRRVTPTDVSVMIVTKADCQVQLNIYEYNDNSSVASVLIKSSSYVPLVKLGQHVYVKVLNISNISPELDRNKTYGYNINFNIGGTISGLDGFGILEASSAGNTFRISNGLVFNIGGSMIDLPTFILPPIDIKDLRVLHGSCRKPHGEGIDAMSDISSIINDGIHTSGVQRPHMLFLTGDQIYADDVSPTLLYMIDKYAQSLLGWDEDLSVVGCDTAKLAPGKRSDNIVNTAKFSVDEDVAGSHLMKLREFIIMYLMVWSRALWSENTSSSTVEPILPDFADVYPGVSTTTEVRTPAVAEGIYPVVQTMPSDEIMQYNDHKSYLASFFVGLNNMAIPNAMANIPVYMIFDDHEITDDLLYNEKWYTDVITNSALGKRIVTNGMAAYAIFQDWGNKPEDYASGPGLTLLNTVANIALSPTNTSYWNTLAGIVLPILDTITVPHCLKHNTNSLNWHYYYEVGNVYEFLVLDTRSMRVFNLDNDDVPGLMSEAAMTTQIEQPVGTAPGSQKTKCYIFVITPTPVIGVNYIEARKERGRSLAGAEKLDLEHWSYDKYVYERFFAKLFTRNPSADMLQVILMGGDVHYGYTSRMQYWASHLFMESGTAKYMAVAGLCASSFKNEVSACNAGFLGSLPAIEGYTKAYHDDKLTDWKDKTANYGWRNLMHETPGAITISLSGTVFLSGILPQMMGKSPFVFERNKFINDNYTPYIAEWSPDPQQDWHYRIDPVYSPAPAYTPSAISGFTLEQYNDHLGVHQDYYKRGAGLGRYIVGVNNMGDISFQWSSGLTKVVHRLWWWNDYNRTIFNTGGAIVPMGYPNTIHEVDMTYHALPFMKTL